MEGVHGNRENDCSLEEYGELVGADKTVFRSATMRPLFSPECL